MWTGKQTAAPDVAERRTVPRREAVDRWARLAWRGPGWPMTRASAELVNVSAAGACVITPAQPPRDAPIWLGLESLAGEWVRAVIRSVGGEGGRPTLHLAFGEPCPAGLLERATDGDPGEPSPWEETPPVSRFDLDWFPPP